MVTSGAVLHVAHNPGTAAARTTPEARFLADTHRDPASRNFSLPVGA